MSRSYQVFIERPRDARAGAADRLAAAMEARYGLPTASLAPRLAAGRLRVKQGVDLETAQRFADDLETLGAVCSIADDEDMVVSRRASPSAASAARPSSAKAPASFATATPSKLAATPMLGRPAIPAPATPSAQASITAPASPSTSSSSLPPRAASPAPASSSLPPRAATSPSTPTSSSSLPARAASTSAPQSALPPRAATAPAAGPRPGTPAPSDFRTLSTPLPGQYASGLAAAFESNGGADLGVLGDESGSFKLATLDGDEGDSEVVAAAAAVSSSPSTSTSTNVRFASSSGSGRGGGAGGPAAEVARAAASFAPPDAEQEQDLELALDSRPTRSARHGLDTSDSGARSASRTLDPGARSAPLPVEPPPRSVTAPLEPPSVRSASRAVPTGVAAPPEELGELTFLPTPAPAVATARPPPRSNPFQTIGRTLAERPRARFAAGVVLAAALAFVPAHFLAAVREDTAFAEIDAAVRSESAKVRTVEDWNGLDEYRAGQLTLKDTRRRNIAISSMLLWAVLGGGLGFLWFRKIPWS